MSSPHAERAVATKLRRAFVFLPLFFVLACNQRPTDVREWRPTDHDHTENPGSDQVQVDPEQAQAAPAGLEDVTIVAWEQNCVKCHGKLGRGDGPQGPMVKARNLSEPAWQASVTDEQIAASIKLGKGGMPSFAQLPDVTIANLVRLVRMMNLAQLEAHGTAAGSAAASASAPSPTSSAAKPRPSAATKPAAPGVAGGAP